MRKAETILVSVAALGCVILSLYLAGWITTYQSLWVFPGAYLVELILLAVGAWYVSVRDFRFAGVALWSIAGVFLGFFFLAGFSIGIYYFPFVILFAVTALLSDLRRKKNLQWHLGIFVLGAVLQAALVWLVLRYI